MSVFRWVYAEAKRRAFGLRREESLNIQRGGKLVLIGSWTKGRRPREISIRTPEHRKVLDRVRTLAGSLIPKDKTYVNHLRTWQRQVSAAGFDKLHGSRHASAQERCQELTGRLAPAASGKTSSELSAGERRADYAARMQIGQELGHGQEQITAVYLGR